MKKIGIRYACPQCDEVYVEKDDAKMCCSYAEEIVWCEECNKPKDDCVCVNGRACGLSLTYDNPFNGRFVVIEKLEDPGWLELAVMDAKDPREVTGPTGFRMAVHESEIKNEP
jgi:hypothetical protein